MGSSSRVGNLGQWFTKRRWLFRGAWLAAASVALASNPTIARAQENQGNQEPEENGDEQAATGVPSELVDVTSGLTIRTGFSAIWLFNEVTTYRLDGDGLLVERATLGKVKNSPMTGVTFGPSYSFFPGRPIGVDLIVPLAFLPTDDKLSQDAMFAPGVAAGVSFAALQKGRPQVLTIYVGFILPAISGPDDGLLRRNANLTEQRANGTCPATEVECTITASDLSTNTKKEAHLAWTAGAMIGF